MNYRHAFHAGNFADLVKHAVLTALIARLQQDRAPLHILDTHAGAGVYDLGGDLARRSGEAEAGIARLMADDDAPAAFDPLKSAVRALNGDGAVRLYPGSPVLASRALRRGDAFVGCELRPDDHALLVQAMTAHGGGRATALKSDGYAEAGRAAAAGARRLILIDPPFEAGDDYRAIVQACDQALRRDRRTVIAIWTPLKDLDTFDRFIMALEAIRPPPTLVAETRLRPLHDPMAMNGCAMVVVGAPTGLDETAGEACRWVVEHVGGAGGKARIWRIA